MVFYLNSMNGESLEVNKEAIKISETIKDLLEEKYDNENNEDINIPIFNVKTDILKKIVDYCNYHYKNKSDIKHLYIDDEDIDPWDKEFLLSLEKNRKDLLDVALAADYLNIPDLFNICARHLSLRIRSYDAKEISEYFFLNVVENEKDQ